MKTTRTMAVVVVAVAGVMVGMGCDNSPPPPRVPVPAEGTLGPPRYDVARPLPGQEAYQQPYQAPYQAPAQQAYPGPGYAAPQAPQGYVVPAGPQGQQMPQGAYSGQDPRIAAPGAGPVQQAPAPAPGAYQDEPIVRDRVPEQRAFVEAYNRVGRPKIAVYVNRRLDGSTIAPNDAEDPSAPAGARTALPAEKVPVVGPGGDPRSGVNASVTPGNYDEAFARALDYEALGTILTDWLAAGGQTEIISPTLARARLTAEQQQAIERGERFVLADITQRLDADIFVQVQARPTRQTTAGLEVRLVAEAINTRGGRSIGRAVVDVPPPLEKTQLNEYTRFLARKLMDDMIGAWNAPVPPAASPSSPAPAALPSAPPSPYAVPPQAPVPPAPTTR